MIYHLAWAVDAPHWLRRLAETTRIGALGVRVFFAISGFLITTLLMTDLERHGTISLRRFYFRRTLRILPPYYVFLTVLMVVAATGIVTLLPGDAFNAWTFSMNMAMHRPPAWAVVHTWSLAVEEQFYLLWPLLLLLAGVRRSRFLLLAVIGLAAGWRIGNYLGWTRIDSMTEFTFRGVADWLAAGSLLALSRRSLHGRAWYRQWLARPYFPVLVLGVAAAGWTGLGYWRRADITLPAAVLGTVLLLDWGMTQPSHPLARPLNWGPVEWVGRISYSLYLWQQPFLTETGAHWWERAPLNVVLAVAVAALSYRAVERPALSWRAQLEPRLAWLRPARLPDAGP